METTRLIKKVKALKSKTGSETELADLEAQRQLLAVRKYPCEAHEGWTDNIALTRRPYIIEAAIDEPPKTSIIQA